MISKTQNSTIGELYASSLSFLLRKVQTEMSKMGSTERLPSFKGPRDLSLSNRGNKTATAGAGTSQGQQAARPRRVYTPNIPPKRERGSAPATSSASVPSTSTATKSNAPSSRGRGERGGRGRGGPGRGRGGKRPELIQEASIFSGGIGDPLDARRAYSSEIRSGYGGGRYRSAASEGRSRVSNMNRTTLNTLIKQEEDEESNAKIFGTEQFEQEEEEDTNPENPNVPVILPLLTYVPDLFAPPSPATSDVTPKIKTEIDSPDTIIDPPPKPPSLEPVTMVRIKQELPDEDDETVPPIPTTSLAQIKQEKLDEPSKEEEIAAQRNIFMTLPLEQTSFAGTLRSADKKGTLAYFQFPDELPVLKGSQKDSSDQPSSSTSSLDAKTSAELVNDLNELPEGFIGRFQVMSTGRTRFILGENVFDVDPGRPVGFLQELCCVDIENKTLTNLGPVDRKFVISPDLSGLLADS